MRAAFHVFTIDRATIGPTLRQMKLLAESLDLLEKV